MFKSFFGAGRTGIVYERRYNDEPLDVKVYKRNYKQYLEHEITVLKSFVNLKRLPSLIKYDDNVFVIIRIGIENRIL